MLSAVSRDVQAVKSELWGVASVDLDVVSALGPIGTAAVRFLRFAMTTSTSSVSSGRAIS
jgi:hypothetical protein